MKKENAAVELNGVGESPAVERCEVLWHFFCKVEKKHVERWLPAKLLERRADGTCEVRTNCGKYAWDAAPECVRAPEMIKQKSA